MTGKERTGLELGFDPPTGTPVLGEGKPRFKVTVSLLPWQRPPLQGTWKEVGGGSPQVPEPGDREGQWETQRSRERQKEHDSSL